MSGGPGSLVSWQALGREGRRHALTYVRPEPFIDRTPPRPVKEEAIDVDSVFAKLKQLKRPEGEEE